MRAPESDRSPWGAIYRTYWWMGGRRLTDAGGTRSVGARRGECMKRKRKQEQGEFPKTRLIFTLVFLWGFFFNSLHPIFSLSLLLFNFPARAYHHHQPASLLRTAALRGFGSFFPLRYVYKRTDPSFSPHCFRGHGRINR